MFCKLHCATFRLINRVVQRKGKLIGKSRIRAGLSPRRPTPNFLGGHFNILLPAFSFSHPVLPLIFLPLMSYNKLKLIIFFFSFEFDNMDLSLLIILRNEQLLGIQALSASCRRKCFNNNYNILLTTCNIINDIIIFTQVTLNTRKFHCLDPEPPN